MLILVAAGLRGWRLAPRGIAAGDEALTALRALGLMEHGRWWTPYWNGAPDLHKPPLYYAMVAVGYCIFGVGTLAIRLPSMAAYLLIIVLAYAMGRRIFDPVVGLGAALLTALHPTLAAQACVGMMDTTMIAFSLAAVYLLLRADEHPLALPVGCLLRPGHAGQGRPPRRSSPPRCFTWCSSGATPAPLRFPWRPAAGTDAARHLVR